MDRPALHGILVLDKPGGITSRDAVNRAQRWLPRGTRVGHTGTLDPLATGVLVLCLGSATRLTEYVQDMGKTYRTRLLLGARSDTDDADGTVTPAEGARSPTRAEVEEALRGFVGEIEQVPPAYSAAKVTGRRAYDLARGGQEVELAPRRVRVHGIDLLGYAYPHLELEVRCGKGTYIRSLARDLGERLGCGALVAVLRRTRVGPFDEAAAVSLDVDRATALARLLPVAAAVAELPRVEVSAGQVRRLRQGQGLPLREVGLPPTAGGEAAVFTREGELVAVVGIDPAKGLLRPSKVLTPI
jgi:tRNA pseudouridine55 synthase